MSGATMIMGGCCCVGCPSEAFKLNSCNAAYSFMASFVFPPRLSVINGAFVCAKTSGTPIFWSKSASGGSAPSEFSRVDISCMFVTGVGLGWFVILETTGYYGAFFEVYYKPATGGSSIPNGVYTHISGYFTGTTITVA